MQQLKDAMMANYTRNQGKRGGIKNEWQEAVETAKNEIKDVAWSFPRWCSHLKGISTKEIHRMLAHARKTENIGRHFFFLVKQYRKTVDN